MLLSFNLFLLALLGGFFDATEEDAVNASATPTLARRNLANVTVAASATTAVATPKVGRLRPVSGTDAGLSSPREDAISHVRSSLAVLLLSNDFGCLTDGLDNEGRPVKDGWRPTQKNVTRATIFTENRARIGRDIFALLDEFEHEDYDCYAGTSWSANNIVNTTTSRALSPRGLGNTTPTVIKPTPTATQPKIHKHWCGNDSYWQSPRKEAIMNVFYEVQYLFVVNHFGCLTGGLDDDGKPLKAGWKPAKNNETWDSIHTYKRFRIGNDIAKLLGEFQDKEFDCYAGPSGPLD